MADVEQRFPDVYKICQKFRLSVEQLKETVGRMHNELELGLGKSTQPRASLKCLPTYVFDPPVGDEHGKFMAVSMGHRHLSVHLMQLAVGGVVQSVQTKVYAYRLPKQLSTGRLLFDFVARCLTDFVELHDVGSETLPLALTACFPLRHQSLSKATIVQWPMEFCLEGMVGKEVGKLLQEAIERRKEVFLRVVAVLNDSTGAFMSCANRNRFCRIGTIVGDGANACYLESLKRIHNTSVEDPNKTRMLINTEWGMFGENGVLDFVRTDYDREVDRLSKNPGRRVFEKLIALPYLSELLRLLVLELMASQLLFKDSKPDRLSKRDAFRNTCVPLFESVFGGSSEQVRAALKPVGLTSVSDDDVAILRYVADSLFTRSARLVSVGLACLVNHLSEPHVAIGIDGFVYHVMPKYHETLIASMRFLVNPGIRYELVSTTNGEGEGGALTAASNCFYM